MERARIRRADNGQTIGNITKSAVVACHHPGESFDATVQRADEALYAAKRAGPNRVQEAEFAAA